MANISRHSSATSFSADVVVESNEIVLTISDNGVGDSANTAPASLVRRAKLLKAILRYRSATQDYSGVTVELRCKIPKKFLTNTSSNSESDEK